MPTKTIGALLLWLAPAACQAVVIYQGATGQTLYAHLQWGASSFVHAPMTETPSSSGVYYASDAVIQGAGLTTDHASTIFIASGYPVSVTSHATSSASPLATCSMGWDGDVEIPVSSNVTHWKSNIVATPDTDGYPRITIKDGTGTGEVDTNAGAVVNVTTTGTATALGTGAVNTTSVATGAFDADALATDAATEISTTIGSSTLGTRIGNIYTAVELDGSVYRLTANALEEIDVSGVEAIAQDAADLSEEARDAAADAETASLAAATSAATAATQATTAATQATTAATQSTTAATNTAAGAIRTAVGLAAANLDTQLTALPASTSTAVGASTLGTNVANMRTAFELDSAVYRLTENAVENVDVSAVTVPVIEGLPRENKPPAKAYIFDVSNRGDRKFKAVRPLRYRQGAVTALRMGLNLAPIYGNTWISNIGTPTTTDASLTAAAIAPHDVDGGYHLAMVLLSGTLGSSTVTVSVPVTMETGETETWEFDVVPLSQ